MVGRELAHERGDVGRGVAVRGPRPNRPAARPGPRRSWTGPRRGPVPASPQRRSGCRRRRGRAVGHGLGRCLAEASAFAGPTSAAGSSRSAGRRTSPAWRERPPVRQVPAGRCGSLLRACLLGRRLLRRLLRGAAAAWAPPSPPPPDPPAPPTIARSAPTGTVSSSWTRIVVSVPATGEGISVSTLSVETSSRGSSTATSSPSCFSQRVMVPSVTDSPSAGIFTVVPSPDPEPRSLHRTRGGRCGSSRCLAALVAGRRRLLRCRVLRLDGGASAGWSGRPAAPRAVVVGQLRLGWLLAALVARLRDRVAVGLVGHRVGRPGRVGGLPGGLLPTTAARPRRRRRRRPRGRRRRGPCRPPGRGSPAACRPPARGSRCRPCRWTPRAAARRPRRCRRRP